MFSGDNEKNKSLSRENAVKTLFKWGLLRASSSRTYTISSRFFFLSFSTFLPFLPLAVTTTATQQLAVVYIISMDPSPSVLRLTNDAYLSFA